MSDDARIEVLDHGFVSLVETWGSEERIIEAARMSTGKGFLGWGTDATKDERRRRFTDTTGVFSGGSTHLDRCKCQEGEDTPHTHYAKPPHSCARCLECNAYDPAIPDVGDEKLLRFLWENKHATPFEMAGATFEVQAPIFVFREWHRHRTQSYNEMSARYTPLPDVNYIPSIERLMLGSTPTGNKQAGTIAGAGVLDTVGAQKFRESLAVVYTQQQALYEQALSMGVPKELARVHLPVGRYSRMRASTDLRNWLGFLALRIAPSAQWEIRQYANAVHAMLSKVFPRTLALFDEGAKR